ncbi:MAG: DUF4349 domain-containing protein [Saprospiraceae bacterium]
MKINLPISLIVLFTLLFSCQNKGEQAGFAQPEATEQSNADFDEAPPAPPQEQPQPTQPSQPPQDEKDEPAIPRQIIKTGQYRIKVEDVNKVTPQIEALAQRFGGYVSNMELTNSNYEINNAITIRVPASSFDSLLSSVGKHALFTQYKKISSQDVTAEYTDILTRLSTKKEVRDRYVDILRNKAKTVQDVLLAEEQIRVIQEEIESKEGRLRFLKDQVAMSTLNLEIYQQIAYQREPDVFTESFWSKLLAGLKNGWELLVDIFIGLVNIWPLVLIGGLFFWKRRWIWGKLSRKRHPHQ